jgi:outer membrane protein OmpA-like peptidoglycan-associated protein
LFLFGSPAHAAGGDLLVSVGGGYWWTDQNENLDSTPLGVVRIGHGLGDRLFFEAGTGWAQGYTRYAWCKRVPGVDSSGQPILVVVTDCAESEKLGTHRYNAFTPRMTFSVNLAPESPVQPIFSVGGGLIYKMIDADRGLEEGDVPINVDGKAVDNWKNPDIDSLITVGPGLIIQMLGPMSLRADFRYEMTLGGAADKFGDIPDLYSDWEVVGSLMFKAAWFWRDTDGDGLIDREDRCPIDPEDYDSFEDEDGCPDVDNDEDGILDDYDNCMHEPEDFDEFQDKDGCPEPDNDLDGIFDAQDDCPNLPEDLDGNKDSDGCPEGDNDGDGIEDRFDRCPNDPEDIDGFQDADGCDDKDNDADGILDFQDECADNAETYNGFEDADGCPDGVPSEVQRFTGVIHGIHFEVNRAKLRLTSLPLLDDAASVLVEYPSIELEIQGHTDSDGDNEHNLELSARRAKAVVEYIVSQGVEPERLSWVGYGEDRPLYPNNSDEEKEANRRVEFHLKKFRGEEFEDLDDLEDLDE